MERIEDQILEDQILHTLQNALLHCRITTLPNLSLYESINKSVTWLVYVILRKNSVTFAFLEGLIA